MEVSKEEFGTISVQKISLPEEIWDIILRDLTAKDFHAVTIACSEWDQVLHHKKGRILFPLILPDLVEYLPLQSVLNCRRLNKTAMNIIDSKLQCDLTNNIKLCRRRECKTVKTLNQQSYRFCVPTELLSFINKYDKYSFNPFLTRSVSLSGCVPENVEEWELNLLSFLAHFGHNIWSLDLHTDFGNGGRFLYAAKQINLLNYLPNLKQLKLSGFVWRKVEVKHLMRLGRLPDLKQLICLDVETSSWVVLQLLLRQSGPNLHKFHLRRMFQMSPELNWKRITKFVPNVKELKIIYDNAIVARSFPNLIGTVEWHLEKLGVESQAPLNLSDFIGVANQFSNTLVELEILTNLIENEDAQLLSHMPVFHKLKILRININSVNKSWFLNVLKHKFPNLIRLYIFMGRGFPETNITTIQTEIELLPEFKKINVQFHPIHLSA
ncbi:hypothetical protein Ocin01_11849 [Orchesella cincta]|uniref:Uncharacterized protein n=1 Tax=Orchesella cincta TaxID=48709 RepID=A0A1D2MPK5_ORCCI|nr:hypothetical protein Ocin01_11849 [Orchesella cincta]